MRPRHLLLPLVPLLLLTSCGEAGDDRAGPPPPPPGGSTTSPGRDPSDYVTDYSTPGDADGAAVGAVAPSAADEAMGPTELPTDPNTFTDHGQNPWTDPATDARSTFGLDVDTGSYSLARQWLQGGSLPVPESVRVEEYLNAVIDLPAPEGGDDLHIVTAGGRSTFPAGPAGEEPVHLLRVGVQSPAVDPDARPDVDLVFVVDVSGSMDAPDKLGLVQASLALLTQELRPTDTVGIVVYGDQGRVELSPTPVSRRDEILAAIDGLRSEGSTNAEEGLALGYEMARANLAPGRVSRVVLASDGVANVGTTDPEALADQLRADADAGVRLITVGYGMDGYNDTLMEQLADLGDGFYAYVDEYDEAVRLFSEDLTASLVTVADDARSQVTFDPAAVAAYRLLGYENRDIADEDFTDDTTDAGEIGAGHSVTALYEVRLHPDLPADASVATVDLRWLLPGTAEARTASATMSAADLDRPWEDTDRTTRLAAVVAAWAEVLAGRPVMAERSVTLDQVAAAMDALAAELGQEAGFGEVAELIALSAALA